MILKNILRLRISNYANQAIRKISAFSMSSLDDKAKHPTIQKIVENMNMNNFQSIVSQIKGLTKETHQVALKLILKKIYIQQLSIEAYNESEFIIQLRKHPHLYIDALLFKIKEMFRKLAKHIQNKQLNKLQLFHKQIMTHFEQCLQIVQKIPQNESYKQRAIIFKRIADYYFMYGNKLTKGEANKQTLKRCVDYYKRSLAMMSKLITKQTTRLRKQENQNESQKQKNQEKELQINTIRQSVRVLVETNAQTALYLYSASKQLLLKFNKNKSDQYDEVFGLNSELDKAIAYYKIFDNITAFSIYYYKLKKSLIHSQHQERIYLSHKNKDSKTQASEDQLRNELLALYGLIEKDLPQISADARYLSNLVDLTTTMFQIKYQTSSLQHKDHQTAKIQIFKSIQLIFANVKDQDIRKKAMTEFTKVNKQKLKAINDK